MGSGNNSTPITSGLLRRRYSVPEIIMRKHSLAQQKSYEESVATTAPTPHISPLPGYSRTTSTSTSRKDYTISSGSDSNLSRRPERGEMSMRKSTLLRRIWSRELKRYDTRSGSWSPPMRRSQRRLHNEPVESHRCEECRKLEEQEPEIEEASRKRLRLISNGNQPIDEISSSVGYSRSVSERLQVTTPSSFESSPLSNGRQTNVHIFMTPIKSSSTSEPGDQGQDMLRVEIELENDETNGNSINLPEKTSSSDENDNRTGDDSTTTTVKSENGNGDSPLDRFISKLLIDNLADLADEINEQFENNNNIQSNNTDSRTTKVSSVYLSPEHLEAVVNRSHITDVPSINSTTSAQDISDSTKCPEEPNEKVIYFPSCSLECKDDMSSYTSNNSDFELNNIPSSDLVKVSTGSTYPLSDQIDAVVVSRQLNNFPRTESLEAHPSSASMLEENANDSEDSVSLVDSLDEPVVGTEESAPPKEDEEVDADDSSITQRDKGEAFFIPIEGSDLEEVQSQTVADSMPEKLKEKILQRQRELDTKREEELKKKQKKIEKIMDPKLEEENFYEKSPVLAKKELVTKEKEKPAVRKSESLAAKSTKTNTTTLRTEIGLLESYTIDSKGNMQFKGPQKTDTSASSRKPTANKAPIARKHGVVAMKPPQIPPRTSQKKPNIQNKPKKSVIKDVQKMTIFQAQSDIITPDHENGPRRVYQKTEIQDGEKRIEILEIVECMESSPESSPDRYYTYRCTSKSAIARRSKIPIPIYKAGRSAGFQKSTRCPSRESSPTPAKSISRNLQTNSSNKVDRVIAELLIDALNRPDEVGIEIIKSPKDITSRDKGNRRQVAARRTTPRRSANSGKYQQVFEVIPEERSSFSVDSSAEEPSKVSKETSSKDGSSVTTTIISSTTPISSQKSLNRGRVAVDRDEPKAWIGFFKRHNDSSMDEGRLMHCL